MGFVTNNKVIKAYSRAIREGRAAIFAGAGLSVSCKLPDWKALLKDVANELNLDLDKEHDLIAVAQFYINKSPKNKNNLLKIIKKQISKEVLPSENHTILASLPINTYWTTNYDNILEKAINAASKSLDKKYRVQDMAKPVSCKDVVIYKMHGDICDEKSIVISKEDYEKYHENKKLFVSALEADLISKTFLFIGFSFYDPNLLHIISQLKLKLKRGKIKHYCIYKTVQAKDFSDHKVYEYAHNREKLWIKDMERYGVNFIQISDYDEIRQILCQIKLNVLSYSIFISGSAHEYIESKEIAVQFIYNLTRRLAIEGYRIISGFGLGVGRHVINGTISAVREKHDGRLQEALAIFPFPLDIDDEKERAEKWDAHRREMIGQAGVALFIYGNNQDGKIAQGVINEFEIARQNGLLLLPISATGYAAKVIWEKMCNIGLNNFQLNTKQQNILKNISDLNISNDSNQIINMVIKFIRGC